MIEPRMVWSYDLQRPEKFLESLEIFGANMLVAAM